MAAHRFSFELTITDEDTDRRGLATQTAFVQWIQDAAQKHSDQRGYGLEAYRALRAAFVVRRHAVEHLRPARAGDVLTVTTWLESTARISSQRITTMTDVHGREVVRAETTWVWVALDTMRPGRIPHEVRAVFGVDEPEPRQSTL